MTAQPHREKWICAFVLLIFTACTASPGDEISATKPYPDVVGAKYMVVGDNLFAYDVYESDTNKTLSYIDLVPLRIEGRELAFRETIRKGQVIRIVSVWRHFVLLESGVYYLVALEDSDFPQKVPIRVELSGGNEGQGAELNPKMYKKLTSHN